MNIAKLKGKMAEKGINQTMLANALKINKDTLSARMTGKKAFTVDEANSICSILGIEDEHTKCEIFLTQSSQ